MMASRCSDAGQAHAPRTFSRAAWRAMRMWDLDMRDGALKDPIGFIGLGTMGRPMAANLIKAGYDVCVPDRPSLSGDLRAGARVLQSVADVASANEVIILMLPDTPDVEDVLFGPTGISHGGLRGKLVIDMSSISPAATAAFADRLAKEGAQYVDAPVSGGEIGAIAGSLTIMAGGPCPAFERAVPILRCMGSKVSHIGERNGAGQACKIANQIIVASNIQAVAEAFALMQRCGVDLSTAREALLGGFAASRILEVHGQRMIDRKFDPGFRIVLHRKDIGLALAAAREFEAELPTASMLAALFDRAIAEGDGEKDHSFLATIAERNAGIGPL
jgi:2-hydroxy-3-oxopropionate reductase